MEITLGFSPCPNDTFLFDALVHGKTDTEGFRFVPVLADVEELNRKALRGELDMTKLSYRAFFEVTDEYALLDSGSALGRNCGPLLISARDFAVGQVEDLRIVLPGEMTTAHFLFQYAYPNAHQKSFRIFNEIESLVLDRSFDAGVIIHENRFTYAARGLRKIVDLGEYWEQTTGYPIPLGGIAVRRSLPAAAQEALQRILRRSVAYALNDPDQAMPYVQAHASEMSPEVQQAHIRLYVNDYSLSLGDAGRAAIEHMRSKLPGENPPRQLPLFAPGGPAVTV